MAAQPPGFIERVVSYGAVSYAFGFIVVMSHTLRLGLPVITLVDPVYVWLGFPFALVALGWAKLEATVRVSAAEARAGVVSLVDEQPPTTVSPEVLEALAQMIAQAAPAPLLFRLDVKFYRRLIPWLIAADARSALVVLLVKALSVLSKFLSALLLVGVVAFLLALYVWILYPSLPKAIGGGAPANVRLVVSRDALPEAVLADLGGRPRGSQATSVETDSLELLYSTADAHYVRTRSHRIVSLSTSAVDAVIWLDSSAPVAPPEPPTVDLQMTVHFGTNSTTLAGELERAVEQFARRMNAYPTTCVRLDGHADADGAATYNLELSRLRLNSVGAILEREGVRANRILLVPHGSTSQLIEGRSPSSKAQNRRVDLSAVTCAPLAQQ